MDTPAQLPNYVKRIITAAGQSSRAYQKSKTLASNPKANFLGYVVCLSYGQQDLISSQFDRKS